MSSLDPSTWDGDTATQVVKIALPVVIALAAAAVADRVVRRRADAIAARTPTDAASILTTWGALRRVFKALIIALGILFALLQVDATEQFATTLLASTALFVAIASFAAQTTLASVIAGVLIALARPFRLGDRIEVDEERLTVEEIALTYTYMRGDDGRLVAFPNNLLSQKVIRNSSVRPPEVSALRQTSIRVPLRDDEPLAAARERLEGLAAAAGLESAEVVVAALEPTPVLEVRGWADGWERAESARGRLLAAAVEGAPA